MTAKDVERVAEGTGKEVESRQGQKGTSLFKKKQKQEVSEKIPVLYVSYDGTGVPVVPWETAGRKGKQTDGSSRTREVKLGCVFTRTTLDPQGRSVRYDASTSFVGAIKSSVGGFTVRLFVVVWSLQRKWW